MLIPALPHHAIRLGRLHLYQGKQVLLCRLSIQAVRILLLEYVVFTFRRFKSYYWEKSSLLSGVANPLIGKCRLYLRILLLGNYRLYFQAVRILLLGNVVFTFRRCESNYWKMSSLLSGDANSIIGKCRLYFQAV